MSPTRRHHHDFDAAFNPFKTSNQKNRQLPLVRIVRNEVFLLICSKHCRQLTLSNFPLPLTNNSSFPAPRSSCSPLLAIAARSYTQSTLCASSEFTAFVAIRGSGRLISGRKGSNAVYVELCSPLSRNSQLVPAPLDLARLRKWAAAPRRKTPSSLSFCFSLPLHSFSQQHSLSANTTLVRAPANPTWDLLPTTFL